MEKIKELDIELSHGWENHGGKSFNVWGTVPIPRELLTGINADRRKKKKSAYWTAYDKSIYKINRAVKVGDLTPKISATFKSCFSKYSAICENMGMKIAHALDMPTSYNYIVSFSKDNPNYKKIVGSYPRLNIEENLNPICVVSIDFLQGGKKKSKIEEKIKTTDENGNEVEGVSIDDFSGEKLVSFEEAVETFIHDSDKLDGKANLIENWIKGIDKVAENYLKNMPLEKKNKQICNIHDRIARSFLLRELLGDCDFTAYNSGLVVNDEDHTLRYAPNHDYGESFNKLVKIKLDKGLGMSKEAFDSLPDVAKNMLLQRKERENKMSVADIAKEYASSTSKENFEFVVKNFPEACTEFFTNLDRAVGYGTFDTIVDSYKDMYFNDKSLINDEEAEIFKDYLVERALWMSENFIQVLKNNNMELPVDNDFNLES